MLGGNVAQKKGQLCPVLAYLNFVTPCSPYCIPGAMENKSDFGQSVLASFRKVEQIFEAIFATLHYHILLQNLTR